MTTKQIVAVVLLLAMLLGAGLYSSSFGLDEKTPLIAAAITLIAFTVRAFVTNARARNGGNRNPSGQN